MRNTRFVSGALSFLVLAGLAGCTTTTTSTGGGSSGASGASSSGGSSGGGSSSGGVDTSHVTALPATAFVFVKHERANADHIYSFDLATGKATLLNKLKDDGTNGTKLAGPLALSHDRKLVAFAAIYEVVPADAKTPGDAQAIWTMSVDGQSFARVSSTLPPPNGTACTTSANCLSSEFCGPANVCLQQGYNVDKREPAFTLDDKTVGFTMGTFWTGAGGRIEGGSVIATAPVTGGLPDLGKPLDAGCAVTSAPSISPDGAHFAAFSGVCTSKANTIAISDIPPTKVLASFPATETSPRLAWAPDGSAIYYLLRPNNGQLGVVMQPVNGGAPVQLVNPTDGVTDVIGLALSPDGQTMIGAVTTDKGKTCDLASLTNFTGSAQPQVTQLTNDGKSCDPAWR